jgi:hypothetical protein
MEKKDWEKHGIYKLQDCSADKCCSFHVHYYANLEAHVHSIIQQMPCMQTMQKKVF